MRRMAEQLHSREDAATKLVMKHSASAFKPCKRAYSRCRVYVRHTNSYERALRLSKNEQPDLLFFDNAQRSYVGCLQ